MLENLNYDPENVRSGKAYIASIAGSGVAFGFLVMGVGEEPQAVAIAPKMAQLKDLRIGDTFELGYVENFPEHITRVPWRAVAVYGKVDKVLSTKAQGPSSTNSRRTIEEQVLAFIEEGEVWNRAELYYEMFNETFVSATASEVERSKYDAIGQCLLRLHNTGSIACAKVYAPAKANASALYYAKTTHILGRYLMGLDDHGIEDEA